MSAESTQHPSLLRENNKQPRQSNREKSEKQIGVRLPRELIEYIEEESGKRQVSTSVIVREAIEFYGFPHLWERRSIRISESMRNNADLGQYAFYEDRLGKDITFLNSRLKPYGRVLRDLERRYKMFQDLKESVRKSLEKIQRDIKKGTDAEN